jgi:hypothetical protein
MFEKSIAAKPTEPFGYRVMGDMYISEGDWDDALTFYHKALMAQITVASIVQGSNGRWCKR